MMFSLVFVLSLVLAACGSDEPDAGGGDNASNGDAPSSEDGGTAGGDGGTATVVIDGTTYEFSGVSCVTGGAILLGFEDGDDMGSITSSDGVNLIRLEIDGVQYVDNGSAPEPTESGGDYSWSGPMSDLDGGEDVQVDITYDC